MHAGTAPGVPEPLPALHPNLAKVYRQSVARLEQAFHDPRLLSAAAIDALRALVDAIVVYRSGSSSAAR
jgi:hypothetical protein